MAWRRGRAVAACAGRCDNGLQSKAAVARPETPIRTACQAVRRRFSSNRSGAAAVEFAIIAPVFVLLFMGMIAYAIYFGALHSLQQLAADAARISIAGLDETERETMVRQFLDDNADGYIFIDRSKLSADVGDNPAGTQFVVRLSYDASDLPIWTLLEGLPLPGQTIVRTSTIRVGGI